MCLSTMPFSHFIPLEHYSCFIQFLNFIAKTTELHAKYKIIMAKTFVIDNTNDSVRAWKLARPKNMIDNPTDFENI